MKSEKRKIFEIIIITLLFSFAIVSFSVYGYGASIHGDEYFSIGFANNVEDFLFVTRGVIDEYGNDGWIEGEFLHDWLSVQPGEQFAIMQIHRNVRNDVHPPLYFMLLNFISSLFVDQVTLIPGYFINVCAQIVICIFLYLISGKIFVNKWLAYVPPLFWAASNAASISTTYIRMYGPLCALCLICLYLHLEFLEKEKTPKYLYILLGACTTIGTLTHYYYYIWLLVIVLITVCICIYRKEIKRMFLYGVSLFLGEVVSLAAYPYMFKHLLFSERGTQVQQNLANTDWEYYKEFLGQFKYTINRYVYMSRFHIVFYSLLALLLVAILCKFIGLKKDKEMSEQKTFIEKNGLFNFAIVAILALGYFLILFKISYSANWIYISPIFALLVILTVGVFAFVLSRITPRYYAYVLFVFCAYCMVSGNFGSMKISISEHERIKMQHENIVSYSDECDVLFFYDEWNNLYDNEILELMEFDQIRAIPIEDMPVMDYKSVLDIREKRNDLMLYIPTEVEGYQDKIDDVYKKIGGVNISLICEDDHAIYYVEVE